MTRRRGKTETTSSRPGLILRLFVPLRKLQKYLFGADFFGAGAADVPPEDTAAQVPVQSEDKPQEKKKKSRKRKAAWVDEDDEAVKVKDVTATYTKAPGKHGLKETSEASYAAALRGKFASIVGAPKWAELDRRDGGYDSDEEFFKGTTDMLDEGGQGLTKGHLDFRKLRDVNDESHAEGSVIRATEFHPQATVGLVAGINGAASLFQIDGKLNPKIQTVNFANFPIRTAHFSRDGSEFVCGSSKADHLFSFDLHKAVPVKINNAGRKLEQGSMSRFEVSENYLAFLGRFGHVHLLSARTKEKAFSVKMNDDVGAVAFTNDGSELYTTGGKCA